MAGIDNPSVDGSLTAFLVDGDDVTDDETRTD